MLIKKPYLLLILDGFGLNSNPKYNAVLQAKTPYWDFLISKYAVGSIEASGEKVGLPKGQFGNSEVGHLNIGAGRIVRQEFSRINHAIDTKTLDNNPDLINNLDKLIKSQNSLHLLGLCSDGGVHSDISHIKSIISIATHYFKKHNTENHIYLHLFLDGRDVPPKSAIKYINDIVSYIQYFTNVSIATISGRYYAMDRDKRYDRVEIAYNAIINAKAHNNYNTAINAIECSYKQDITDEFVVPCIIGSYQGLKENDGILFANFRSDRAIQLTDALVNPNFSGFNKTNLNLSFMITMTQYDKTFNVDVLFKPEIIKNTLGEYLSGLGYNQLRIAETEKYPHVTYFFNGGIKEAYANEDRILIPSPRDVATYDLKPEMSLPELSQEIVKAFKSNKYDFVIANFANGDMVGHTGELNASILAVEAIDKALGLIIPELLSLGGEAIIIADHGNCELMYDEKSHQKHTQHTTNLVPFLYIGRESYIISDGALEDVAPSLLSIADIIQPSEMSGKSLIKFK